MKCKTKYSLYNCNHCNKPFFILNTKKKQSNCIYHYCSYECKAIGEFKRKKCIDSNGYSIIPILVGNKIIQHYEHRAVMESWLDRKLNKDEIVHHIDGNKLNNNINNLEIKSPKQHLEHHLCKEYNKGMCKELNCNNSALKVGLCNKHYLKYWKIRKYKEIQ